jgi:hypothetical protein
MLLIEDHMTLLEEGSHLGFEVALAVVFFLGLEISHQGTRIRGANRERSVTALPGKIFHTLVLHPFGRICLKLRDQLCEALRRVDAQREVHMVRHTADAEATALPVAGHDGEVSVGPVPNRFVDPRPTPLCAEHNMNQGGAQRLGHAGDSKSGLQPFAFCLFPHLGLAPQAGMSRAFSALLRAAVAGSLFGLAALAGCKKAPAPVSAPPPANPYPPRPTASPAPFKLFHQTDNSLILVVPESTPDPALAALLWQLRDAAHTHTFGQLHLPQKFIDARAPKVFFHVYRGAKCAPETYAKGPYPCGASYHGSADFSIGGFHNPDATDGSLVAADGAVTHLWSAE